MDPSNFLDIDPLQDDVLKATAEVKPQTQKYEGFEMVDTYLTNPIEQYGAANVQALDNFQNNETNSEYLSEMQQVNSVIHESIEPYPSTIVPKKATTTINTVSSASPINVQKGYRLSKAEEDEILKLVEKHYTLNMNQELNSPAPQASQNIENGQMDEGFNLDDLVYTEPSEGTYIVNEVPQTQIVNNDIFSNQGQIQAQISSLKANPLPSAAPVQEEGLTLGNMETYTNVNDAAEFGEYTTTNKIDSLNAQYVTPIEPVISKPISNPVTPKSIPQIVVSKPVPPPAVKPPKSVIVKVPKVKKVIVPKIQKVYVPSKKKIIVKKPNATTSIQQPISIQSTLTNPIQTTKVTALPKPVVPVASSVNLPYSVVSIPAVQTTPVAIAPKTQVPVASTVNLPYSVSSISAVQTKPVAVAPKPLVPVASTVNLPYSVVSIPAVQTTPVAVAPKTPVPVASTVNLPYSVASIPAVQTKPVAVAPKTQVPAASTVNLPYSVVSIPAVQTTPVAVTPKTQVPAASTVNLPYSVVSIPAVQTTPVAVAPKTQVPTASTVSLPYSVASIPAIQASTMPTLPIQPIPAIPLPAATQRLIPVSTGKIASGVSAQKTIPYSTMSQPIPYSTYSQPVTNQNPIPSTTIATLPNPFTSFIQNQQILPQTLPTQSIIIGQQQIPNLPYQTTSFNPLLQNNSVPYGNMSRPNEYRISSYIPNFGGQLPLQKRLGGITNNTVGNMSAPRRYSSKTYNARKL